MRPREANDLKLQAMQMRRDMAGAEVDAGDAWHVRWSMTQQRPAANVMDQMIFQREHRLRGD